ncbi:MAG: fused ferrous iron transport protein A/B [Elusimicrobia bacterium]|nr:fused ferrous iron transport protein A/B [Elusimicrobiota bacterium]
MTPVGPTSLLGLHPGEEAVIETVSGGDELRGRLSAMGLHEGRRIRRLADSGRGGPVVVDVMGSTVALGRRMAGHILVRAREHRLLLTGNPNVGKSVVFSRLTGLDALSSNYPGTTVEFLSGAARFQGERFQVIDVPGTYSLSAASPAETVACRIIAESPQAVVVHVIDATNLERNLLFALQMIERGRRLVLLLNKRDLAALRGISIDAEGLGRRLGAPVVPFVAVTGEGLRELERAVLGLLHGGPPRPAPVPAGDDGKWRLIGELSRQIQTISHKHPGFMERLAELSIRPATGIPMALAVLAVSFLGVRVAAEGVIHGLLEPAFQRFYLPSVLRLADLVSAWPAARAFLVGTSTDPLDSFGVLTTGVYIPFIAVLPYLAAFYFVLGYLEDLGYLPRLAVILDRGLHRLGLHGYGAIPMILGLGCKVPGLLATRVLETPRERLIAMTLTLLIAPCLPQSAMILSQVGRFGILYALAAFGTIALVGISAGMLLHRLLQGECPELFVEIPPYQWPRLDVLAKKTWLRVRGFLREAVPLIAAGVALVGVCDVLGLLRDLSEACGPAMNRLFGLPADIAPLMVLGFLRKDVSIAMLGPFHLGAGQAVVASVFLTLYLPCFASLSVLVRETGIKQALAIAALNLAFAVTAAGVLHLLL